MFNYKFVVGYQKRLNSKSKLLCNSSNYFFALRVFNEANEKGVYSLTLVLLDSDLNTIIKTDELKIRKVK